MISKNFDSLFKAASSVRKLAHVPYSNFKVGAAFLTEDNKIITGDDDVDLLINYKYKNKVLKKMISNKSFKINKKVSNKFFVQYIKDDISITSYVDFYFYYVDDFHP